MHWKSSSVERWIDTDGRGRAVPNAAQLLANPYKQRLNFYQLACGYVQRLESKRAERAIALWFEGACYHVRVTYHEDPEQVGFIIWDGADTLKEARRLYAQLRQKHLKRTPLKSR